MSDLGMIGNRDGVSAADLEPLLAGYRPLSGIFDEMMDRHGRVRAHWQPLLAMFARLGPQELSRRFSAADRHLHESGVFYRVYEDASGAERPWPLSHVPLLINGSEWQMLKAGLIQRAECTRQCSPMPMARQISCASAGCRPPSLPATRNSCGRSSESRQQAARTCGFMRSMSAALVGAPRPHPGTFGLRLCARESHRAFARNA